MFSWTILGHMTWAFIAPDLRPRNDGVQTRGKTEPKENMNEEEAQLKNFKVVDPEVARHNTECWVVQRRKAGKERRRQEQEAKEEEARQEEEQQLWVKEVEQQANQILVTHLIIGGPTKWLLLCGMHMPVNTKPIMLTISLQTCPLLFFVQVMKKEELLHASTPSRTRPQEHGSMSYAPTRALQLLWKVMPPHRR